MKLKLSYIQFMALFNILKTVMVKEMPVSLEDRRDHTIIIGIYQKFYVKAYEKKKSYSIKLLPHEAMTWFIYFSFHNLPATTIEGNTLTEINNSIHKKYAS
jgi:hypothetical protein